MQKEEINFEKLNSKQVELIRKRLKLLNYIDRLNTFEELHGGVNSEEAKKTFSATEYACFREQNIVEYSAEQER